MDKEEATKLLAKELGDKLGRTIVTENAYKGELLKDALSVYQSGQPERITEWKGVAELMKEYSCFLEYSNYIFLEGIPPPAECYDSEFIITPYALIGEKEEKDFRRLFYKDIHPDIIYAADILGIKNFIGLYEKYKESSLYKILKDFEDIKKIIDIAPHLGYDGDNEISKEDFEDRFGDIDSLNEMLGKIGAKTRIIIGTLHSRYIEKGMVLKFIEDLCSEKESVGYMDENFLNEFIDFIFILPYEDQNIEANKEILKKATNLEFVAHILSKEYTSSNTHHFQTYFDILSKGVQEKVVKSLWLVSHNSAHDSFLWSQGFKGLEMDYLGLYSEDAGSFIEYFSKKGPGEKKIILGDILKCEHMNQEVIDWLDANEPELLKEVSFNG